MSTKAIPGEFDCYAAAMPDEPMFVLLARDPMAPSLIRGWARRRGFEIMGGTRPVKDIAMIFEALECADDMETWRKSRPDCPWRARPIEEAPAASVAIRKSL